MSIPPSCSKINLVTTAKTTGYYARDRLYQEHQIVPNNGYGDYRTRGNNRLRTRVAVRMAEINEVPGQPKINEENRCQDDETGMIIPSGEVDEGQNNTNPRTPQILVGPIILDNQYENDDLSSFLLYIF